MNEFKSKHGYYSCDRDTYLKLKELKKFYYESQRQLFNWFRWDRKQEQNRVGPEPKYPDLFITKEGWTVKSQRIDKNTEKAYTHYKYHNRKLDDQSVLNLFQRARMPNQEPVDPFDQTTLDLINRLYIKMK